MVDVILPKVLFPITALGKLRCGRLNRLKNSVRNATLAPSRKCKGKPRVTLRSVLLKLGQRRMLRPRLPKVPGIACATADVLKYRAICCPRLPPVRVRLPAWSAKGSPWGP